MYNTFSSPTLTNVTFSGNSAFRFGGGMFNYYPSSPTLTNVTFSNNLADSGGGMYNRDRSHPSLTNVILWGNIATTTLASTPLISHTLIQGSGGSGAGWDTNLGTDGGGNIDADPLFVDAPNDDMHLKEGSPAIDSGGDGSCPLTDLDGVPRPQGEGCDMGAFEFWDVDIYLPMVMRERWMNRNMSRSSAAQGHQHAQGCTFQFFDQPDVVVFASISLLCFCANEMIPTLDKITAIPIKAKGVICSSANRNPSVTATMGLM